MTKLANDKDAPLVAVIMGSKSDWEVMSRTCSTLDQFGIATDNGGRVHAPAKAPIDCAIPHSAGCCTTTWSSGCSRNQSRIPSA